MKKPLIAAALVVSMSAFAVACDNGDEATPSPDPVESIAAEVEAAETMAAEVEETMAAEAEDAAETMAAEAEEAVETMEADVEEASPEA